MQLPFGLSSRGRGSAARQLCCFALLAVHGSAARAVAAGLPEYDPTLEELLNVKVITATQTETEAFRLPFAVQSFGRADFDKRQPRTLPQWLEGVPGVMVQKTANSQQSPFIRGFTGFRTLLLIDGIRLNNSVFREGPNQYWNTVDGFSIERLELVKGPASVLYGSDSIGGTVNALSIGPGNLHGAWNGGVRYRYSSAEDSHIVRAETAARLSRSTRASAGVTVKSFGNLRVGGGLGTQLNTGYDERALDVKVEHALRSNLKLTLAHQTVDQGEAWRTHSTPSGTRWLGLRAGSDAKRALTQLRHLSYIQVSGTQLASAVQEARVTVSLQEQDETQTRVRSNGRAEHARVDVYTFGLTSQFRSNTAFGDLVYGTTYYHDRIDSENDRYLADATFERRDVQGPVGDDSLYRNMGVFIQDQLPPWRALRVTFRGRLDRAEADVGRMLDPQSGQSVSLKRSWNSAVASGRAGYTVSRHLQFFAGASQGFRAPNISDLSRLDIAASGQIETPSADVNPEKYLMSEIGAKWRSSHVVLEATVFRTDIRGMVIRTPTGRTLGGLAEVTKRNSGSGFLQGAEFQSTISLGSAWSFRQGLTWMDGEITVYPTSNPSLQSREPMSRMMPLTSHLSMAFAPRAKPGWLELACTMAGAQTRLAAADRADLERIPPGGTPGYRVWIIRGGWRFSPQTSLTAAVENITDRAYRIHGSGINEPGRNVIITGSFKF